MGASTIPTVVSPSFDPEFGSPAMPPRVISSRGAVVGEFAIRPGVRVRNHCHDAAAVVLVLDGALAERARIGPDDGQVLSAGMLRVLPAGDSRDLVFGAEGAVCLVVELPLDRESESGITRRMIWREGRLIGLAARLRRYLRDASADVSPLLELDLLEFHAQLARGQRPVRQRQPPRWLSRIRDGLNETFAYPEVDRLGAEAGVHPLHLMRAFRDHYGCTIGDVVRRVRLDGAIRRIVETDASLSEVAATAGYADQSHMTREITRVYGLPPARLRLIRRNS